MTTTLGTEERRDQEMTTTLGTGTTPGAEVELPKDAVDLVPDIYPREHIDKRRVELFADMLMDDPKALPPIEVVRHASDGARERYILVDGRHRLEANKKFVWRTISARVLDVPAGIDVMKFAYMLAVEACAASSLPLRASERAAAVRRVLEIKPGNVRQCDRSGGRREQDDGGQVPPGGYKRGRR